MASGLALPQPLAVGTIASTSIAPNVIISGQTMRIIVDLPDSQIAALRELERRKNVSRAELVRQAVAQYVLRNTEPTDAFGAWKMVGRRARDGLAVQKKLRSEWKQ